MDRAAALTKLRTVGIDPDQFSEVAENYSLGRLYGLLDRLRHHSPTDEQAPNTTPDHPMVGSNRW